MRLDELSEIVEELRGQRGATEQKTAPRRPSNNATQPPVVSRSGSQRSKSARNAPQVSEQPVSIHIGVCATAGAPNTTLSVGSLAGPKWRWRRLVLWVLMTPRTSAGRLLGPSTELDGEKQGLRKSLNRALLSSEKAEARCVTILAVSTVRWAKGPGERNEVSWDEAQ